MSKDTDTKSNTLYCPGDWMERPVRVLVVGAGGTGSEVVAGLARLDLAMRATGHPAGLDVVVIDDDTVSPTNLGRQVFGAADLGRHKAVVLVQRCNLYYGTLWKAAAQRVTGENLPQVMSNEQTDILITCVDRASVRLDIARAFAQEDWDQLWLDTGNDSQRAQVVLGHLAGAYEPDTGIRLPHVADLYPELRHVDDDAAPSCSMAEALSRQDLFINRFTADCAVQLLNRLLRYGKLDYHGAFIDVAAMTVAPLRIDPATWAFMGYDVDARERARREVAVSGVGAEW